MMTSMTDRLKAKNVYYVQPVFQKGDPKELFIGLNELDIMFQMIQKHGISLLLD